jgi:mono/diheme cytochrome c family protein
MAPDILRRAQWAAEWGGVIVVERRSGFRWILIAGFALWIGCSDEPETPGAGPGDSVGKGSAATTPAADAPTATSPPIIETPAAPLSPEELIEAGRSVYNANCIACHSLDPSKDGALGPAVAGSSLVLLEARVLRAEYPEAYQPKRTTRVMVALPHLEPRLVELAAYLESPD